MAGGNAILQFQDFVAGTIPAKISGPNDIINDAVNRTYFMAAAMKGRMADEVVQSGSSIIDRWQGRTGSQFEFYGAGATFNPQPEETLTNLGAAWRFAKDCWVWTDQEIELNSAGSEAEINTQWVNLKKSKEQAARLSMLNGMEAAFFAVPNFGTMENMAQTGGRPYALGCFITENGIQPPGWTGTVEQADPVANPYWRNQVANYAAQAIDTSLIPAFDQMWRQVKFESVPTMEEYMRNTKFNKMRIYSNLDGVKSFVRYLRSSNDRNMPMNDAGWANQDPVYGGIPVSWIEVLENYNYALGQPRFWWINFDDIWPVWHSKRYMRRMDPMNALNQPYTWVVYLDCWYNVFCRSRRRQGIIVPQ